MPSLVEGLRPVHVVLDRVQEAAVARELRERHLRLRVEVLVVLELAEERDEAPPLAHRRHAQEEVARIVVLRDRLEGLEILQPQALNLPAHTGATTGAERWLRQPA